MLSLARPLEPSRFGARTTDVRAKIAALVKRDGGVRAQHFKELERWREFKPALANGREARCGYCERVRTVSHELDVEHYRPKSEVRVWAEPVSAYLDEPPRGTHCSEGYWWLAYEWQNYALACKTCNQRFKGEFFPVRGAREPYQIGMELRENPLLLHPHEPFGLGEHFSWDAKGHLRPCSDRGHATIVTCGLNRRALVAARRTLWFEIDDAICRLDRAVEDERDERAAPLLRWLEAKGALSAEFAGMVRWQVTQWTGEPWAQRFAEDARHPALVPSP